MDALADKEINKENTFHNIATFHILECYPNQPELEWKRRRRKRRMRWKMKER